MKKYAPYLLLTGVIMLPLLLPGYIFMLDMVFTPDLRMPETISNDYLWHALLFLFDLALPSQLIQKVILVAIPLLATVGMHRLIEHLTQPAPKAEKRLNQHLSWYWATYLASIFYAVNPFTYSRVMAGQYAVLLGYALLPFFVRALLVFMAQPSRRSLAWVVGIALITSIISIHTVGMLILITLVAGGVGVWQLRGRKEALKGYLLLGLTGIGIFIATSSYWLIPLATGNDETAQTIQQFDKSHSEAFATAGDNIVIQIINVLKLQGFWLDGHEHYVLPQDRLPGWGTIRLIVWALIGYGFVACWRHARRLAIGLAALGVLAVTLAVGIPENLLTNLGYREPHKFAALLALVFAVLIAFGSAQLLHRMRQLPRGAETKYGVTAGALLLVVILFTPTMYWGFGGQLKARQYPDDWQRMNQLLSKQPGEGHVLFLPWHQYMSFDFAGRIIANPTEQYFDKSIIASHDPEIGNIKPEADRTHDAIHELLKQDKPPDDFAQKLAKHNIQFILLAKEFDYKDYRFLESQTGVAIEKDTSTLRLYRNTAYQEAN
jgi:hypothetical protein